MSTPESPAAEADIVGTSAAGPAAMRGGVLRTASFVFGLLIGLASAPLVVRHLGDVDFGRYASALVTVSIIAGLTDGGISTIAVRELSVRTRREDRDELMADLLGLRLALSGAGSALAIGFAAVAGYGTSLVLGVALAAVGMILGTTQALYGTVLHSQLRFGWAAVIDLVRNVVGVGLIAAIIVTDGGVVELLATAIPASVVALAITVALVREISTLRPAFRVGRWLPLLRDTLVFAVAVAVNTLYFRVTLVVMGLVATGAQTGHFAISYRVMEVLIGVPLVLIGAAFPIISRSARSDRDRFDYATGRIFELSLFLGGLTALALFLGAPFAIEVLTGRDDHPSVPVLQIQSPAIAATFVAAGVGYALLGMGRHRAVLIANLVPLVLAVVIVLVLAPEHGAQGAAVAALVADVALAVSATVLLMRDGGPGLPVSAVALTAVAAAAGYVAGWAVGVHPVVQAAVGVCVFLAALVLAGRFPPEVRELLARTPRAQPGG